MKRLLILLPLLAGLANAGDLKPAIGAQCDNSHPARLYMDADIGSALLCKQGRLAVATRQELSAIGYAAKAKALSVHEAIDRLKKDAIPVVGGQILKDPNGCLYGISFHDGRLGLIQVRDEQKRPVCDVVPSPEPCLPLPGAESGVLDMCRYSPDGKIIGRSAQSAGQRMGR